MRWSDSSFHHPVIGFSPCSFSFTRTGLLLKLVDTGGMARGTCGSRLKTEALPPTFNLWRGVWCAALTVDIKYVA